MTPRPPFPVLLKFKKVRVSSCQIGLTNTQLLRLRKAFSSNSSANMNLVKIQLCKLEQTGVFLGRIPGRLLKTGLRLELAV